MSRTRLCLTAAGILAACAFAGAQEGPHNQWELVVSGWVSEPVNQAEYTHSYVPLVDNHSESTGTAGNVLDLQYGDRVSPGLALNRLLSDHLGLQLVAFRGRSPISGVSSDYTVHLEYQSRQPPDYQPVWETVSSSQPWPDPKGELEQTVVACNLLVRLPPRDGLQVDFSAGVSAHRLTGSLGGLAYTHFWEGGHAVLFSSTYAVETDLTPVWKLGFDVGGTLAVALAPGVELLLETRYFKVPVSSVAVTPRAAVSRDGSGAPLTSAELAQRMRFHRLALDPSTVALGLGVRFHL
jgi:hypothetical protein